MKLKPFLKFVEIETKVASLLPFITGTLFVLYRYKNIKLVQLFLFFISMLSIDLATTAINNFIDYRKAIKREGYNYETHNAMVRYGLENSAAVKIIFFLLLLGSISGLLLYLLTDGFILVIGIVSFVLGIIYSFGPLPISRTPFGEIVSGIVMGGFIFFVSVYIHVFDLGLISCRLHDNLISLNFDYKEISIILLLSLPLIFMISNIMLANNICDVDDDVVNRRFTLPYFLGKDLSLKLFSSLYIASYVVITVAVILRVLPVVSLITLLTIFPLFKNIKDFKLEQKKSTTFVNSVKNIIIFSSFLIISLVVGIIIKNSL